MSLRVIAGSAKGRRLKLVPGNSTRPIMDRVKEAMFSIIGRSIIGANFLDLYAGTGSVGIEALSRGAVQTVFIELDRLAVQTIQANLKITGLGEKAIIRRTDVLALLKQRPPATPYDYIFLAPPQYQGLWLKTLRGLDANPAWISEDTTVIVQIDPKEYEDVEFEHLETYDERSYGKTLLVFMRRKTGGDAVIDSKAGSPENYEENFDE
jgi:16S rRNA (guanine966-N2)-methyltransferase